MIAVTLTTFELRMAAQVGMERFIDCIANGRRPVAGGASWQQHIEGACGELAVAKALGRYWNGSINTFKTGGDVGNVQVRTRSEHHYELIVQPRDRDDDYFVLVTGVAPTYRVIGYMRGGDAKRDEFKANHGGHGLAYFVPHSALQALGAAGLEPASAAA